MKYIIMILLAISFSQAAFASGSKHNHNHDHDHGKRKGPPPQAIEACKELSETNTCSFTGRHGQTVTGTCTNRKNTLTCSRNKRGSKRR